MSRAELIKSLPFHKHLGASFLRNICHDSEHLSISLAQYWVASSFALNCIFENVRIVCVHASINSTIT